MACGTFRASTRPADTRFVTSRCFTLRSHPVDRGRPRRSNVGGPRLHRVGGPGQCSDARDASPRWSREPAIARHASGWPQPGGVCREFAARTMPSAGTSTRAPGRECDRRGCKAVLRPGSGGCLSPGASAYGIRPLINRAGLCSVSGTPLRSRSSSSLGPRRTNGRRLVVERSAGGRAGSGGRHVGEMLGGNTPGAGRPPARCRAGRGCRTVRRRERGEGPHGAVVDRLCPRVHRLTVQREGSPRLA
jgi:hypothetical protein